MQIFCPSRRERPQRAVRTPSASALIRTAQRVRWPAGMERILWIAEFGDRTAILSAICLSVPPESQIALDSEVPPSDGGAYRSGSKSMNFVHSSSKLWI